MACNPDKILRELGEEHLLYQILQERNVSRFRIGEDTEPELLVSFPEIHPFVKLTGGNAKALAELFHRIQMGKEFPKHPEYEEKAITGIGNDEIRKDSMGMATAVTHDSEDTEVMADRSAVLEIHDISAIIGMGVAASSGFADGAGLQFRPKPSHEGLENRF